MLFNQVCNWFCGCHFHFISKNKVDFFLVLDHKSSNFVDSRYAYFSHFFRLSTQSSFIHHSRNSLSPRHISIHRCTFCASLHVKTCPDRWGVQVNKRNADKNSADICLDLLRQMKGNSSTHSTIIMQIIVNIIVMYMNNIRALFLWGECALV